MRNRLKWILASVFLITVGVLGFQFYKAYQIKEKQSQKVANLPEFSLHSTKSDLLTHKDINQGDWTVFVFFNSECHFCQEEAQQLKDEKEKTKAINFLWISSEAMERIGSFQKFYELSNYQNVTFLQDPNGDFATKCNISSTPQFLVYDTKGKLAKNHKGAWRIDTLLDKIAHEFKTP